MNVSGSPSTRLGMYAPHMTSKQAALSMTPLNMRTASLSRPSGYDMGIVDSQNLYGRQSYSVDHSINYNDEDSSTAFSTHSPGYVLNSTAQGVLMDYPGLQWDQKNWDTNLNGDKAQNGGLFTDQDTESASTQASYSYMHPGQGTLSAEVPPVVPSMQLPSDGGAERTLPNPGSRNNQLPSNMPVIPTTPESVSGLQFTQDFRIGNHWNPRPVPASLRASLEPMVNGTFSPNPATRTKVNGTAAQDMTFGYLPITTTDTSPSVTSSGAVTGLETPDTTGEPRMTRSFSRDNGRLLSLTEYTPEIYGYSTSEKSKNRDNESATLMGGLQYTRVKHPDTNAFVFDMLPADAIPDYRPPTEALRTSISPVGNHNGL
ncbi:hemagglutinin protein [Aspergillus sclerotialis]|uniref:Hemagglutinin protein n=1 Tax=Aspergillus sclerotialis TaxID=2070753 RepID=A0A3A2ZRL6_9EURO|nr:hemagglutinin protein [Aspergillus sclerotialis]